MFVSPSFLLLLPSRAHDAPHHDHQDDQDSQHSSALHEKSLVLFDELFHHGLEVPRHLDLSALHLPKVLRESVMPLDIDGDRQEVFLLHVDDEEARQHPCADAELHHKLLPLLPVEVPEPEVILQLSREPPHSLQELDVDGDTLKRVVLLSFSLPFLARGPRLPPQHSDHKRLVPLPQGSVVGCVHLGQHREPVPIDPVAESLRRPVDGGGEALRLFLSEDNELSSETDILLHCPSVQHDSELQVISCVLWCDCDAGDIRLHGGSLEELLLEHGGLLPFDILRLEQNERGGVLLDEFLDLLGCVELHSRWT
mmetsp:Transcript_2442/g.7559  ORF Transcript_2442/g.7559 Transcript_2442/m.7559 type:complete len:311 (+) Transcript_2442:2877-3809(+)